MRDAEVPVDSAGTCAGVSVPRESKRLLSARCWIAGSGCFGRRDGCPV